MIFIWLIAGCLLVSVPFAIAFDPYNLWPSVYAGGYGAAVYLTALLIYSWRTNNSKRFNSIVSVVMLLFFIASGFHWTTMDTMTAWQRGLLGKIRSVIAHGIFYAEDVSERALPVYAAYHQQKGKKKSIVELFNATYQKNLQNGMFVRTYKEGFDYDPNKRYVQTVGNDAVVLISVDTVARGMNQEFRNIDGSIGRVEMKTTLTAKEVRNERVN